MTLFSCKAVSTPILWFDGSSSQATSNDGSRIRTSSNAVLQDPTSRDYLLAIPFKSSEDEDARNIFQSLKHDPSHVSSSLSIKRGLSNRMHSDSSNLNTKKKPGTPISLSISTFPFTFSYHSESSQQNPFIAKILSPDPKRDESAKVFSTLRPETSMKLKHAHYDPANDFGQPVTIPKSPVDFPSVTSSSKTTDDNVVSSTPQVIQLSVTQTSRSQDDSVVHNNNTSETNNRQDSIPITQPLPCTSKKLVERNIPIVREISIPGDLASDKPSTSPDVLSLPLNPITTDSNPISPKDNRPIRKVKAKRKSSMNSFLVSLVTF